MTAMRTPIIILAALALSACVNLGGGKPPPFLLTLDAKALPAAGATRSTAEARPLTILVPASPQKLRTPRIPVQQSDGAVAYIVGAQWVDAPQRLFQRLIADTLGAKTSRLVVDDMAGLTVPGEELGGQLLEFGVDARTGQAVVVFQAMVIDGGGKTLRQQRFMAQAPVALVDGPGAAKALNTAANQVAADVAAWVGE
jgi:cholesterol transport system auxiliary component